MPATLSQLFRRLPVSTQVDWTRMRSTGISPHPCSASAPWLAQPASRWFHGWASFPLRPQTGLNFPAIIPPFLSAHAVPGLFHRERGLCVPRPRQVCAHVPTRVPSALANLAETALRMPLRPAARVGRSLCLCAKNWMCVGLFQTPLPLVLDEG